jgi:predicted CXXCH cytochrome family protein
LGLDLSHPRAKLSTLGVCVMLLPLSALRASSHQGDAEARREAAGNPSAAGYVGDEVCAKCHASIYQSYEQTAMAHASGPALDALTPADFTHKASGVHYRIYSEKGRAWLSFERPGDEEMRGKRELLYYIGSGRRGRTYLFENQGFLFESPVNWYANKQMWDTAPAYQSAREAPLDLPAYASCLDCHVSGMRAPEKGTENRYPEPAFTKNGVGCERCHGPGAAHVVGGAIVNPAKLRPARRDEVCMQCHLEGKVAIERAGRHVYEYRPGDKLADYIRYFELVGPEGTALGAVSQVEALAESQCKKKSGDQMSCTSCHNPHEAVSAENRAAYFRARCLACHSALLGNKHHADQPDCTRCHMPASASADVAHTQVTDHRIRPRAQISPQGFEDPSTMSWPRLVAFPENAGASDARDLALAWTSLVESGMTAAEPEARSQLAKAAKQSPDDPAILSALAYSEQKRGATADARELYQRLLAIDPGLIDAETNLGVIEGSSGNLEGALKLWLAAFQNAPDRSGIGLNIARAYCAEGRMDDARMYVRRVLEFNPDLGNARQMLEHMNRVPPNCGA